jgi:hypothetical protein
MTIYDSATTQTKVFEAFLAAVKSASTLFNDTNTWISDDPSFQVPSSSRHKVYCIVYPMEAPYSAGEFYGGGQNTLIEETGATVAIHVTQQLRQNGKPWIHLSDPVTGLWKLKHDLLKKLTNHELVDGEGNKLLTHNVEPIFSERPTIQGVPVGDLALSFKLPFRWDLS